MMTELSFWEKYPFKSFMFLHYKGLELNSSFIPSSPDCWCRWRNVVSGSRRLWTSAWDFFWKVLRVANQAQRMTLLSGSTMPDRYCDEHAKACLWEIERPVSDTEGQSFHSSGTFQTFKYQDYIMRVSSSVSYWFEAWMWWPLSRCGAGTVGRQTVGWRWTALQRRAQATGCLLNSRWCRHLQHEALVRQTLPPTAERNTETERVRKRCLHLREWNCNRMALCPEVSVTTF